MKKLFNLNPISRMENGFTLIELLVVISVIGLLLAILMPALSRARGLAKELVCSTQFKQIGIASMLYGEDYEDRVVAATFDSDSKPAEFWFNLLRPYMGADGDREGGQVDVFICPSDKTEGGLISKGAHKFNGVREQDKWRQHSYGINGQTQVKKQNGQIVGEKFSKIKNISSVGLSSEILWWLLNTNFVYPHKWIPESWHTDWWLNAMPGSPTPSNRTTPIVPIQWHGEKVCVLFLDGHVDKLKVKTFYEDQQNEDVWIIK